MGGEFVKEDPYASLAGPFEYFDGPSSFAPVDGNGRDLFVKTKVIQSFFPRLDLISRYQRILNGVLNVDTGRNRVRQAATPNKDCPLPRRLLGNDAVHGVVD